MNRLKIKQITFDNWLQPDLESMQIRMANRITGKSRPLSKEKRIEIISGIELSDTVPSQVINLFEVAKGALIYAYFYYPLYSLAADQVFRVAETAISFKCQDLKAPKNIIKYSKMIAYLVGEGILSKSEKWRWDALRRLRNAGSHPESGYSGLIGQ